MKLVWMFLVLLLAGCGGTDKAKWSEEVLLHDGKKIVVKMEATRNSSGFPDSRRGSYKRYEIEFPSLNVTWREEKIGGTIPKAVEVVNGLPYVVLLITGCGMCEQQGYPDPSLVIWRWSGQKWEEAAYRDLPPNIRLNILGAPWDMHHDGPKMETYDLSGFYSLERKIQGVCSLNAGCSLGQLLSEYVKNDPSLRSPGAICTVRCKRSN